MTFGELLCYYTFFSSVNIQYRFDMDRVEEVLRSPALPVLLFL